jgi:hypothetical protein
MEEPDCLLRVLRRFWLMAARFPPTLRCVALSAVCRLTITGVDWITDATYLQDASQFSNNPPS